MLRIGVNALYLIPGGVGGTEIYLRNLLGALAEIDAVNQYVVFTNRETGADLVPRHANFVHAPQAVRASFRPARILWEQMVLPFAVRKHRVDVLFNPGFTAPAAVRLSRWSRCFTICSTSGIRNIFAGSICRSGICFCGGRRGGRGG